MSVKVIDFPILFAEDDKMLQDFIVKVLQRHYSCVLLASNGIEAWDFFVKNDIKVLIVDLIMPKMGGIELIRKVREANPDVYIIVTSAYSETEDLLASIHLKVNHYLIKPVEPLNLISIINDERARQRKKSKITLVELSNVHTYNLDTKMLLKENTPLKLTKTENKILELLVNHIGTSVGYDKFEHIWGDSQMTLYALRTHLMQLKKKLGDEVTIDNLSGQGYILNLYTKQSF